MNRLPADPSPERRADPRQAGAASRAGAASSKSNSGQLAGQSTGPGGKPGAKPGTESGTESGGGTTTGEPGDHELIRLAQRGDERAFELLVRRHEARAWRVARNLVASADDARDLVQDAFLRVFRNLERFDFEHEFSTWLFRIVTNLAIDQLRRRRATASTTASDPNGDRELELADPDAPSPSHRAESLETAARVRVCLASLAPHFRNVLALREIEGLGCPEIAEIVGATHVTVRWRLHRGRKLFQEEWERRERLSERGDPSAWAAPKEAAPSRNGEWNERDEGSGADSDSANFDDPSDVDPDWNERRR
ncbi:MAG: sigma-70 family RNA polymerase sigma factor [Planctomycetes bacterium]|nr:sigma-70 family RNA polymerase sigma factor [Planctomycetota bacterium]